MCLRQAKHGETLWQIYLSPSGQLRVTHLPLLERHVEQSLGLVSIACIEDTAYAMPPIQCPAARYSG